MHPAALYTLVDLPKDKLSELQRECESQTSVDGGKAISFPTRSRFIEAPLRAVFDHHIELGKQESFDPIIFILVTEVDWRKSGLLLVSLDAEPDDEGCKTDKFRLKAEESGRVIVGIQFGNADWEEAKESYPLDVEKDDRGGDDENDGPAPSAPDDEGGPIPPTRPSPGGYYIGVYGVDGVDRTKLIRNLQPGYEYAKKDKDCSIRLQAVIPAASLTPEESFWPPWTCIQRDAKETPGSINSSSLPQIRPIRRMTVSSWQALVAVSEPRTRCSRRGRGSGCHLQPLMPRKMPCA